MLKNNIKFINRFFSYKDQYVNTNVSENISENKANRNLFTNRNLIDQECLYRSEIENRIFQNLKKISKINLWTIDYNQTFENDLNLDSLERTMLVSLIEHEFKIAFEDKVFDNFNTLNDIVNFLDHNYRAI